MEEPKIKRNKWDQNLKLNWLWELSQKWFTLVSSNLDTKIPSKQKKKIDTKREKKKKKQRRPQEIKCFYLEDNLCSLISETYRSFIFFFFKRKSWHILFQREILNVP